MQEDRDRRRRTQPLDKPSFGSTFRNPPGEYAGRLVEAVGLKGHRVGGAMWSDVHANFVVNVGGATARDVLALVNLARARVKERFGIVLETEVRLVGEFARRGAGRSDAGLGSPEENDMSELARQEGGGPVRRALDRARGLPEDREGVRRRARREGATT